MPAKNSIKQYLENGYYHLYNRGVEKRKIFQDEQDYSVFLSYLKEYLTPKDEKYLQSLLSNPNINYKEKDHALRLLRMNNFYGKIDLLSYCLNPNHFHFELRQNNSYAIDSFINSLGTRYTMYFNEKNKRVGSLYQGVYKAVLIESDEQLLHLSRYIHRQALNLKSASKGDAPSNKSFQDYNLQGWKEKYPSSFLDYLGQRNTSWVKTNEILNFFSKNKNFYPSSYEAFVLQYQNTETIYKLFID